MLWTGTRPTSPPLATFAQLQSQLRIRSGEEEQYILDLLDACTEYAEQTLDSSLLTRTITATYWHQGAVDFWGSPERYADRVFLPRGPVISVTSVIDANGQNIGYQSQRFGLADFVQFMGPYASPVVVTYQAGYGATADTVPADIRMAIRTHVAHLFERREAADEQAVVNVPLSLVSFYGQRRRTPPVG